MRATFRDEQAMVDWRGTIDVGTVVGFRFVARRLRALVRLDSSHAAAPPLQAPAEELYGLQVARLPRRCWRTRPQ